MKPAPIGRPVTARSSRRILTRLIYKAGLCVCLVLPGLVYADILWPDFKRPFNKALGIPLYGSQTVSVDLPQELLDTRKDVCLTVDIESNFYFKIDGFSQKGFEGFRPKVSVNNALIFGNYEIGAKPLPIRQTVDVHIKRKYLKAGLNTLKFAIGVDPQLRYSCERGSKCIAYFIHSLHFEGITTPGLASRDRDIGNIACGFETPLLETGGWNLGTVYGRRTGSGGFQTIAIDTSQGAGQTQACLKMTFKLGDGPAPGKGQRPPHAVILNRKPRDLSTYSGIEFFAKTSRDLISIFGLAESQPNRGQKERWTAPFRTSPQWRKIRIAFDSLSERYPGAHALMSTDGKLDLNRIETLFWSVKRTNDATDPITLCIDEIRFY